MSVETMHAILNEPAAKTNICTPTPGSIACPSQCATGIVVGHNMDHVKSWVHTELQRLLGEVERVGAGAAAVLLSSKEEMVKVLRAVCTGAQRVFVGLGNEVHVIAHAILEQQLGQPSPRGIPSPCLAALSATRTGAYLFFGGGDLAVARALMRQV